MKTKFKMNLGNIVGAAVNSIPELKGVIDPKALSDMTIETEAEFTISEARGMAQLGMEVAAQLPDLLASIYKDVLVNDKDVEFFENSVNREYEKCKEEQLKVDLQGTPEVKEEHTSARKNHKNHSHNRNHHHNKYSQEDINKMEGMDSPNVRIISNGPVPDEIVEILKHIFQ